MGAAHIDVMADYESRNAHRVDKVGSVRYSIGGTAYNIAINLGQYGVPVKLATVLKQTSFSSVWIREGLESSGVGQAFVEQSDKVAESGFVATRRDGKMESAVTSSAVSHHTFRKDRVDLAIAGARLVVLDCNLAQDQLALLVEAAQSAGSPLVVAAVSDSRVKSLTKLTPTAPLDLVSMNELEAKAIGIDVAGGGDREWAALACDKVHASIVVVTRGAKGWLVLRATGQQEVFQAPEVEKIESPTGAGDALVAALVASWYRNRHLDFQQAQAVVALFVRKVLEQPGATAGSLAVDADFAKLAKIAIREGPWFKRFLTQEVGVAAGIVIGLASLMFTAAQVWYAKRADQQAARAIEGAASAPRRP